MLYENNYMVKIKCKRIHCTTAVGLEKQFTSETSNHVHRLVINGTILKEK